MSQTTPDDAGRAKAKILYRKDMELEVNGVKGKGIVTIPMAPEIVVRAKAPGDSETVTLQTLHREIIMSKVSDRFEAKLTPSDLERNGLFYIRVNAMSPKFLYSGGLILVTRPETTMQARVLCNGENAIAVGAALCQSREGYAQMVRFLAPMKVSAPNAGCPAFKEKPSEFAFEVNLGPNECPYSFTEVSGQKREFWLMTYGYEEFLLGR